MNNTEAVKKLMMMQKEIGLVDTLYFYFRKNIRVNIGLGERYCKLSIDELMLSVRSHNALRRANINTLGELVFRLNEGNLKTIRNLGAKSYSEIQTKILVYAFELLSDQEKLEFFYYLSENNVA